MAFVEAGWQRRDDDPEGVTRWSDGHRWTARITGGAAATALAAAKLSIAGQRYPELADLRRVEALEERVREIGNSGVEPGLQSAPAPVNRWAASVGQAARTTNGLAIASLITALIGAAPLAVIFGHMANSQIKTSGADGSGMAAVGLVLGYVELAFLPVMLLVQATSM
ncbi:DUF4190 domain-containing protein [Pengzhenrongella phosphoraccumulans]|uniref:DUF4190 domain-containing protein n=1 Tax=Pengzhenrongella phosphoraccumulans TaxID=3114394 RepID=UPI0038906FF6